jgi:hypothetical protein
MSFQGAPDLGIVRDRFFGCQAGHSRLDGRQRRNPETLGFPDFLRRPGITAEGFSAAFPDVKKPERCSPGFFAVRRLAGAELIALRQAAFLNALVIVSFSGSVVSLATF